MATYVRVFEKVVGANAQMEDIIKLQPSEGEKYHFVGLSWSIAANGFIEGFVGAEKHFDFLYDFQADANHVVPVDFEITSENYVVFRGTDRSGATNMMRVLVVYEIIPIS